MAVMTMRDALNEALREEMQRDERVMLLGEDIAQYEGSYKVTKGLLSEFGEERVKDTPIAEAVIAGCAIGAAMGGMRPVAEMMTVNFLLLAMDQVVNHAAKVHYMFNGQTTVPLVIRAPQGAGKQLGAQHSQFLEAYFTHCPGLFVVAPATPADAKGLLKSAIRDDNPVIFLENQNLYNLKEDVPDEADYTVPMGKACVVRDGADITLVSYSNGVHLCLEAAQILTEQYGIGAEVIDLRTLMPLDLETILTSLEKTHRLVLVSEGWRTGNYVAEVAMAIQELGFDLLDAPIQRVTGKDVPMPYNQALEQAALPQAADIIHAALWTLS
jgi:pyruvate dehydrogenase E1 component beta subunit